MTTGWNQETKSRLSDKVASNMNDVASATRQILKGSKASEVLDKASKNFAYQDAAIENSSVTIKKMGLLVSHLHYQADAIEKSVMMSEDVRDQLKTILK